MSLKYILYISIALSLLLLVRIQLQGGLEKEFVTPELEYLASALEPQRFYLSEKINSVLPSPQNALLSGILLGVRQDLPSGFKKDLQNTSTIHIVVVSGQNLTLLGGFLIFTLASIIGRKKAVAASIIICFLYSVLTGLQIPVLRAFLMLAMSSIALFFGRERMGGWIIFLTAYLMIFYNPNWLLSISFQLSFLATIAVVLVAPILIKSLNFLPDIIKQDFSVSLAAQLLTFPVIASNFYYSSISGVLVNTLILWVIPPTMLFGSLVLVVSLVNITVASLLALIPNILLTYFVYLVSFFSAFSFLKVYIPAIPVSVWVGYYLALISIFLVLDKRFTSSKVDIDENRLPG